MSKEVDFYFDYGSPTSYLAHTQIGKVASRAGASVNFRPILLGGVFAATGNRSPMDLSAKGRWMQQDISSFAKLYDVPFNWNSHFPINTLALMRGAVFAQRGGFLGSYSDTIFKAVWVDDINMNDPKQIRSVLVAHDIDADAVFVGVGQQLIKDELKRVTDDAVTRGVFGAPTFFVGDRMIFGQDRLMFVEADLKA